MSNTYNSVHTHPRREGVASWEKIQRLEQEKAKLKSLLYQFWMIHNEYPIDIDFRNDIGMLGVDEGQVKGEEMYQKLLTDTEAELEKE